LSIIVAIIIFSLIILFHELGHFIFAKAAGIKVNEFCLGLGPTVVGFQKGETFYSIKALPFGGACMMEGEDSDSDSDRSFQSKSVWRRISVVIAGPAFNFIMAFICSVILIGIAGYDKPVISDVMEGYPVAEAGFQQGDVITKVNGRHIYFYREFSNYITFHDTDPIELTVKRGDEQITKTVTPKYSEEDGRYLFGVKSYGERESVNFIGAFKYGFFEVRYWVDTTFYSLRMLVKRQVSMNEVSGPVGIVKVIGDTYDQSVKLGALIVLLNMLYITILLSANLGVMNLLPLPALDGGRLVFLIIEAVTKKRVPPEKEGLVHGIGIVILLALMVLIMFNDIRNIIM